MVRRQQVRRNKRMGIQAAMSKKPLHEAAVFLAALLVFTTALVSLLGSVAHHSGIGVATHPDIHWGVTLWSILIGSGLSLFTLTMAPRFDPRRRQWWRGAIAIVVVVLIVQDLAWLGSLLAWIGSIVVLIRTNRSKE